MNIHELETESVAALPVRLETSDFNTSLIGIRQSNVGVQLGVVAVQGMLQANSAGVSVTQINL